MAYTTIKKPSDYFNTKLYTGDGSSSRSITGVNFQPDWTWVKSRNSADYDHMVTDVVRGTPKMLKTNSTAAEAEYSAGGIGSFDSDGFTIAAGSSNNTNMNNNTTTYVGWNWKANGAGSANTDGSISSTVSVNTTSGFSIVSYTGNATAGATIGHGLGSVPKFAIFKRRNSSGNWQVYHHSIGNTDVLKLNGTDAKLDDNTFLNDTSPSSSLITLGGGGLVNGNGDTHICYAFAEKQGYSKFGSYTGNGNADGTFVYTGFKPAFVINKRTDSTSGWDLFDNKRLGYNVANRLLAPNTSDQEATSDKLDILSNGFKMRTTSGGNYSGASYIYMAFAEAPLVGSNNVPCTAR